MNVIIWQTIYVLHVLISLRSTWSQLSVQSRLSVATCVICAVCYDTLQSPLVTMYNHISMNSVFAY